MPRRSTPAPSTPPWLARLRRSLFSQDGMAAYDPGFQAANGQRYRVQRFLDDLGDRLRFREVWSDPATGALCYHWALDVAMQSFLAISDEVLQHTMTGLARMLHAARPTGPRVAAKPYDPLTQPRHMAARRWR